MITHRPVTGPDGDNPITDEQLCELYGPDVASDDEWVEHDGRRLRLSYWHFNALHSSHDAIRDRARGACAAAYNARHAAEGRPLMHHRRYASGRRTCDLDGQNPAANSPGHEDTHDPTSVDCPLCIADLRARNLLPEAHQ